MTAAKLISILKTLPPDEEIYVQESGYELSPAMQVHRQEHTGRVIIDENDYLNDEGWKRNRPDLARLVILPR